MSLIYRSYHYTKLYTNITFGDFLIKNLALLTYSNYETRADSVKKERNGCLFVVC